MGESLTRIKSAGVSREKTFVKTDAAFDKTAASIGEMDTAMAFFAGGKEQSVCS